MTDSIKNKEETLTNTKIANSEKWSATPDIKPEAS